MKKHRYKVSFLLTTIFYTVPVLLYIYSFKQHIFSNQEPKEKVIELSLSQFVPQTSPALSELPVQEEQIVEEKSEPLKEKTEETTPPKPEPETKPVPEKEMPQIIRKKPVEKPVVKRHPKVKRKKARQKVDQKKRKKTHRKRQISGGGSPHYSAAQKNRFLANIRQKIERAKSYPRIAQRRGMQGTVHVKFTILKSGHVGNITLSGPKVFYTSARKAVKSAFPINAKRATLSLPLRVNLSLHYKLR